MKGAGRTGQRGLMFPRAECFYCRRPISSIEKDTVVCMNCKNKVHRRCFEKHSCKHKGKKR